MIYNDIEYANLKNITIQASIAQNADEKSALNDAMKLAINSNTNVHLVIGKRTYCINTERFMETIVIERG